MKAELETGLCSGCSNAILDNGSLVGCKLRSAKEQVALIDTYNKAIAGGEKVLREDVCQGRNKDKLYGTETPDIEFEGFSHQGRMLGVPDRIARNLGFI